jgi:hypothetical protein
VIFGIDLNQAGRSLLHHMDYRVGGIASLVICGLLSILRYARTRTKPTILEFFNGALGVVSIYGGIVVATIFLLTKPPAVEYLSGGDLMLAAIVTLVGTGYLGWGQLKAGFFPRRPPRKEPKASDSQTISQAE